MATKVDVNDPNVKKLVYNMYRDMLGSYNARANDILDTLPPERVVLDQGVVGRIEAMMRQSSQIAGGSPTVDSGVPPAPSCPAPPPPPPAPLGPLPGVRLNSEVPRVKEPPAAVLNAMMSKDKKPFTYTPGGLDLSQIRSPRMQRRVARNAAAEGTSEQPQQQPSPSVQQSSPVPTFAAGGMPPPPPPMSGIQGPPPPMMQHSAPPPPMLAHTAHPQIVIPKNPVLRATGLRHDMEQQAAAPEPYSAAQEQNFAAPDNSSNYAPPSQAKMTSRAQLGSLYIPPVEPVKQSAQPQFQPQTRPAAQFAQSPSGQGYHSPSQGQSPASQGYQSPQNQGYQSPQNQGYQSPQNQGYQSPQNQGYQSPQNQGYQSPSKPQAKQQSPVTQGYSSPVGQGFPSPFGEVSTPVLNKAPTPWLSQPKPAPQVPAWAARDDSTRVIPIQIEGRDSPSSTTTRVIPIQLEGGGVVHHQQQQHQQQQQQKQQQQYVQQQAQQQQQQFQQQQQQFQQQQQQQQQQYQQQQQQQFQQQPTRHAQRVMQPVYTHNKFNAQQDPSRSVPDGGYQSQGVPVSQLRKMQMTDDDRALMNKFKAQVSEEKATGEGDENPRYRGGHIPSRVFQMLDQSVDEESSLHSESDPRYRGAAIPSRSFRMLQAMTDTGPDSPSVPRGPAVGVVTRVHPTQDEGPAEGPRVPASQQQVQEPRKYTGGAIPSRSFRILQAMTATDGQAMTPSNGRPPPYPVAPSPSPDEQNYPRATTPLQLPRSACQTPTPQNGYPVYADDEYQYQDGYSDGYPEDYQPYQEPYYAEGYPPYWDPYAYIAYMHETFGYPHASPGPYPHASPGPYPHPSPGPYSHGNVPYPPEHAAYSQDNGFYSHNGSYRTPYSHGRQSGNESDGYSSTDEMTFYGANFQRMAMKNSMERMRPRSEARYEGYGSDARGYQSDCNGDDEVVRARTRPGSENRGYLSDSGPVERMTPSIKVDRVRECEGDGVTKPVEALQQIAVSAEQQATSTPTQEVDDEDSDTEVEEETDEEEGVVEGGIQAIPSVSDISVYSDAREDDVDFDDDDMEENFVETSAEVELAHALSVIYEESDVGSDRPSEETDSTSATLDDDDDEEEEDDVDSDASSVTVRLPLKLQFSRTEADREVATVIVGEVEKTGRVAVDGKEVAPKEEVAVKEEEVVESPDVQVTLSIPRRTEATARVEQWRHQICEANNAEVARPEPEPSADGNARTDSDVAVCLSFKVRPSSVASVVAPPGFWETEEAVPENEVGVVDEVAPPSLQIDITFGKTQKAEVDEQEEESEEEEEEEEAESEEESSSCSDNSMKSRVIKCAPPEVPVKVVKQEVEEEEEEEEEEEDDEEEEEEEDEEEEEICTEVKKTVAKEAVKSVAPVKIVDVVEDDDDDEEEEEEEEEEVEEEKCSEAKKTVESVAPVTEDDVEEDEEDDDEDNGDESLIDKIYDLCQADDAPPPTTLTTNESEAEDDSGVTSDMSRHDEDSPSSPKRQQTAYVRASTHSRLFRLLHDVTDDEEDTPPEATPLGDRRHRLTLPLRQCDQDSLSSSSGVNSPASPSCFTTERLVKQLVASLLQKKKGRRLKKLPLGKLQAAAWRILGGDHGDPYDAGSSEDNCLSPAGSGYDPRVDPKRYGPKYREYADYYSTWATPNAGGEEFVEDIVPSKAFRRLAESVEGGRGSPATVGRWARCPRIASVKDVRAVMGVSETEAVDEGSSV